MTTLTWLRVDRTLRRLKRLRGSTAWQHEVCAYLDLEPAQFWPTYHRERMAALDTWLAIRRAGSTDFSAYYAHRYFLLRGVAHRRYDSFYAILQTMQGGGRGYDGMLLDYGGGAGMVSGWLKRRRPFWLMDLVDLPTPARVFAEGRGVCWSPEQWAAQTLPTYDVTLCLDTFEHLPRPHDVLVELLRRTKVGGHLFLSMSPDTDGENIGGQYRCDVLALLARYCDTRLSMEATDQYGHYVKRETP